MEFHRPNYPTIQPSLALDIAAITLTQSNSIITMSEELFAKEIHRFSVSLNLAMISAFKS